MISSTVPGPKPGKAGLSKTGAKPSAAKFMRMLAVETVPDTGLDVNVCASEAERAALAENCGLVAVQTFEAGFHVQKQGPKRYKVSGVLQALVTHTCVVSLAPFESHVRANIDVDFAPSGEPLGGPAAALASPQDPPDPIIGGNIDLGALAAEFLALNLDPYPRKLGATFEDMYVGGEASATDSPFAVLRHRS